MIAVLTCVVLLGLVFLYGGTATAAAHLMFDMRDQGKTIGNKFGMLNSWFYDPTWRSQAAGFPDDYMASNFPFVETVHLMTATGGSLERDLFKDPSNRDVLDDYDFQPLKDAIRQVLNKGLKPYIKTGNVPLKYSEQPVIGTEFGVNIRPPYDYDLYYGYIKALTEDLVDEFGIDEVKTWMWGVLTEYENADWFNAGSPAATQTAYFKLYDYTVAALEDVLGPENLYVGAHSMSVADGLWDEREFIEHVARGVNYKTGEQGTKLDFLAVSFYDRTLAGLDHRKLIETINLVRDKAKEVGLTDLRYGVDEGRVLIGWDNKPLISRAVNMSAQGAADAKLFKLMVDHDIDWFSLWGLSTGGTWGGANAIGSNIANLAYKMVGDTQIGGDVLQRSMHTGTNIDGLASYDPDTQTLRLMVYNNHNSSFSGHDDEVLLEIRHIAATYGDTVTVERWRVDDNHANWWPTWLADETERGLTDNDYTNWSRYSVEVPGVLISQANRDLWRSREQAYNELSQLTSTVFEHEVSDGMIKIEDDLPAHGVAFYEIVGVTPAQVDLLIDFPLKRGESAEVPMTVRVEQFDPDVRWKEVGVSVNGEPIATVTDLPFEWVLNPAMYTNGPHELLVTGVDKDGRTVSERLRFTVHNVLAITNPLPSAHLIGTVPIQLKVGPTDDDIDRFELEVIPAGATADVPGATSQMIMSDALVPDAFTFDTKTVPDGAYDLSARVLTKYGTQYEDKIRIVIRNWVVFLDQFQPPTESWFGVHDNSKTVDRSSGWVYATDDRQAFVGDTDRLVRSADTVEYLVWEVPDINHFTLTVYTAPEMGEASELARLFQVSVKDLLGSDGDSAELRSYPLDISVNFVATSDSGWTRWTVQGQVPAEYGREVVGSLADEPGQDQVGVDVDRGVGKGPHFLEVRLLPSGRSPDQVQLGQIEIYYPRSD